jgi:oxygen-independent coproporphyrinogen-3 oxidase
MSTVLASPADVRSLLTEAVPAPLRHPRPALHVVSHGGPLRESFGRTRRLAALAQRALPSAAAPLSLYVHIPFCEQLCYYCACNKIITKHHERAAPYLDALEAELALVVASLGADRPVSQLHFGGGSPTFLPTTSWRD